jgi:xanthine/CO dehydrogenase XdhC/CoxF family maturation factor
MKELTEILRALEAAEATGESAALATIIDVRGSTYRRPGAHLLVTASGRQTGNISGGCLEGDVAVLADEATAQRAPRLQLYDLTADDDAVWGLGLGCNGAIEVFVEPTSTADPLWEAVRFAQDGESTIVVATVVTGTPAVPAGQRFVLYADGRRSGSLGESRADAGDAAFRADVERAAHDAARSRRTHVRGIQHSSGSVRVFFEVLHPPLRLVVCGAGHDAIPIVNFAGQLGWRVLVVDRRDAFLTHTRYPGATGFVKTEFTDVAATVPADEHTYVLVMTHNYIHDRNLLRAFLPTPAAYIGMLGPRNRTEKIIREIEADGVQIDDARRAQIFGPVGLDIGSETPDEIALAALGEVLAVSRGRPGGFLRARGGPIHAPATQPTVTSRKG